MREWMSKPQTHAWYIADFTVTFISVFLPLSLFLIPPSYYRIAYHCNLKAKHIPLSNASFFLNCLSFSLSLYHLLLLFSILLF